MKLLDSKIFDIVNFLLVKIQDKLDGIRRNSSLLLNIDKIILFAISSTFIVCAFASSEEIGMVSFLVPILVCLKVFMTKGEKIELEKCNFFLLLYLLVCLISCFTSSMIPQSFYGFMKTLIYFAFYFAMCQFLKNKENKTKYIYQILFVIAIIVVFESFIGIFQNSIGVANISTWQDTSYVNPEDVLTRVYGTLKPYNPNLFGGYLIAGVSSILCFVVKFIDKKHYKQALITFVLFLIGIFTIFLTGCRGAYLALGVIVLSILAFSFYLVKNNSKFRKIWISTVCAGGIGSIFFLMLNHGIMQRILSMFIMRGDSSTSFRMNVYSSAIQMAQDNWLYGIGVGNKVFREIYGLYMLSGFDALSCYCIFLEMFVESGIFSLLFFIIFLFTIFHIHKEKYEKLSIQEKTYLFIALTSILAVLFHGIVDTIFFRPQVQYLFWTMSAIAVSILREEKVEK